MKQISLNKSKNRQLAYWLKNVLLVFCGVLSYSFLSAQTVTSVGLLNTARWLHSAHLLHNGKVLVTGGNNGSLISLTVYGSSELYDPISKTWSYTGSMNQRRYGLGSVVLNNGNVLVSGGQNESTIFSSCEVYDVATGSWSTIASMYNQRANHRAITLQNGKVLVAGGNTTLTEIYNPNTNSWSIVGQMITNHGSGMAMVLLDNGKVLATGGTNAPTKAEIYDPLSQQWSAVTASTSGNHAYHSIVKLQNNNYLLVGTQSANTTDQLRAELFNPITETFSNTGDLLTNVGPTQLVLLDDGKALLYSIGDFLTPSDTKCIQLYNPASGSWSAGTYNFVGANAATSTLLEDGTVLLAGGSFTTGNGASPICYLVSQDAFSGCSLPNKNLIVSGASGCNGNNVAITMPASETGVTYGAFIGNKSIGSYAGTGSNLAVSIPSDFLSPGINVVKMKAFKPGCPGQFLQDTANVTYSIPSTSNPVITANGSTSFCSGDNVTLSAPLGMSGYLWTNGATSQTITVASSGYFSVRVSDALGCYSDYSNVIKVDGVPSSIYAGPSESTCTSSTPREVFGNFPTGGTWSGTGISAQGLFNPANSGTGTFTLTYSYCGLTSTKTMTVQENAINHDFQLGVNQNTVCYNAATNLSIYVTFGQSYYIYKNDVLLQYYYAQTTGFVDISTGPIIKTTTIKVLNTVDGICEPDTLAKELIIGIQVDPTLKVGTKTPMICANTSGEVYIVKSQPNVSYQLRIGASPVGNLVQGNGDTLFLNTGTLTAASTFSVYAVGSTTNCDEYLQQTATLVLSSPQALYTISTYNPELDETVRLTNYSKNVTTWTWSFGAANISSHTGTTPPDLTYTVKGKQKIKLLCTDSFGCIDSLVRIITVIDPVASEDCNYSIQSALAPLEASSIALDKDDNGYFFYSNPIPSYFYSPRGDSINLPIDNSLGPIYGHTLVKYTSKGTLQWAVSNSSSSSAEEIITDSLGNIYVSCSQNANSAAKLYSTDGSFVSISSQPFLLLKYNSEGLLQWYATSSGGGKANLALDKDLNVYATTSSGLNKFNKNGVFEWNKAGNFTDVQVDSKGFIWVIRYFPLQAVKYDSNGNLLLTTTAPIEPAGPTTVVVTSYLALDKKDNLYISGIFRGNFIFNKDTLVDLYNGGDVNEDLYLCKLNADGSYGWIKQFKTDQQLAWKGMDLKNDTIVLSGLGGLATIQYNRLPNKTYKDYLAFSSRAGFLVFADTSFSSDLKIKKIQDNALVTLLTPSHHVVLSKKTNSLMFLVQFFDPERKVLGRELEVKPDLYHTAVLRSTTDCLFEPGVPMSQFIIPVSCKDTPLLFTDVSTDSPTSWNWTFPGGTPSSSIEQSPTVTYTSGGSYTATLTSSNSYGAGETYNKTFTVNLLPIVTQSLFSDVCNTASPILLTGGYPANGEFNGYSVYSGPGVKDGYFYPSTAGLGTHDITYTYTNYYGCTASASASLNVSVCTSIDDANENNSLLEMHPNPTHGKVTINLKGSNTRGELSIFNTSGILVFQTESDKELSMQVLDLSSLPQGIYHLKVQLSSGTVYTKNLMIY